MSYIKIKNSYSIKDNPSPPAPQKRRKRRYKLQTGVRDL